jgi:Domain of unknown function (DUF4145)
VAFHAVPARLRPSLGECDPLGSLTMPDDPDTLPDSSDLRGPCPRCGRNSNYSFQGQPLPLKPDASQRATVLTCMGCHDGLTVIEERINPQGPVYKGIHWWPMPGSADLDAAIPTEVGSAYSEGVRALSVKAPRAAAVMFRGMLAHFVADKGSPDAQAERDLYHKLEHMSQDGSLYPSLVEWASEIRVLGNAAAHPDALDPVSEEEAADLGRLCRQLLNLVYEVPASIARNRAARGQA